MACEDHEDEHGNNREALRLENQKTHAIFVIISAITVLLAVAPGILQNIQLINGVFNHESGVTIVTKTTTVTQHSVEVAPVATIGVSGVLNTYITCRNGTQIPSGSCNESP